MHSDLPNRGYPAGLSEPDSGLLPDQGPDTNYLGPLIHRAMYDPRLPRSVTPAGWTKGSRCASSLPTSLAYGAGNLFIPVDTTMMGAGMGPDGVSNYTQNRTAIHLHGGVTPWISDGTPHQWFTPAGETTTPTSKGASFQNVPDMAESRGCRARDGRHLYYTNQQSNRLMFYHDHAVGITRLNVYAGMAAGYLLTDPVEDDLITAPTSRASTRPILAFLIGGGVYHYYGIPLIIQDKTFVPAEHRHPGC